MPFAISPIPGVLPRGHDRRAGGAPRQQGEGHPGPDPGHREGFHRKEGLQVPGRCESKRKTT